MKNYSTYNVPTEATDLSSSAHSNVRSEAVYEMMRDVDFPKKKKKETIKAFCKILKRATGKERKKILEKILPLLEDDLPQKYKNRKKNKGKSKKCRRSDLVDTIIRDSTSTAIRIVGKLAEQKISKTDRNDK